MMGPVLTFRDPSHLDRLLATASAAGIRVVTGGASSGEAFSFRRGLGRVSAQHWPSLSEPALYFGFGHPFNPLLWAADGRLLRRIEGVFLANGSRRLSTEELA